ncbi:uncharacterized protein G2W53_003822 [Senna tora]|uniref:Uncharacterized protein n=1 Tax=Senna tora TaxID=362788 RepID=A0A834XAT4_9FABA|nr:uncharacterized protein G2W53_003822 [Senna tora]
MSLDKNLDIFHATRSPVRALIPLILPNTMRSDRVNLLAQNTFDLYFANSSKIQSRFLVPNVLRHDFTLVPCDHESHSRIKSNLISKYNVK